VVRADEGGVPVYAINNATVTYIVARDTEDKEVCYQTFNAILGGPFNPLRVLHPPAPNLEVNLYTEDEKNGIVDAWPFPSWDSSFFCSAAKPATYSKRFEPVYFEFIYRARLEFAAHQWGNC